MALDDPVLRTCAISGAVADRAQCPAGDLVARARRMAEDAGRRVATVDEARQLIGVAA